MTYRNYLRNSSFFVLLSFFVLQGAHAAQEFKTYILAEQKGGDVAAITQDTQQKLEAVGFEVVGSYSPYADTSILVVTNDELKQNASASEFGAFGAAQRVTVTKVKEEVQIAFTNPTYMANAYRMKGDLQKTASQLKQALGDKGEYGPDKGLTAEKLRGYHYKWLMPYFDDRLELASYDSHETAIQQVEAALASGNKGGVKKVYRVDLPGKQETVIGVAMEGPKNVDCSGDKYIMDKIDFKAIKSSGHLPYEMVISGNKVYALPAEFRIAISFPDLSMMGSNSFASIMCAPNAIKSALTHGAGGTVEEESMF